MARLAQPAIALPQCLAASGVAGGGKALIELRGFL
jgi:hypothetical protein